MPVTPLRPQTADQLVQLLGLVLRQAAGRLVEHDDPAPCPTAAAICTSAAARSSIAHEPVHVDRRVDDRQQFPACRSIVRLRQNGPVRGNAPGTGSRHRQVLAERELLMHHADARRPARPQAARISEACRKKTSPASGCECPREFSSVLLPAPFSRRARASIPARCRS